MSWAHTVRRPRVYAERRDDLEAWPGDVEVMRKLAAAEPAWTPMGALGGHAGSQAVYRLRNQYGADVIVTLAGKGYRLSKRGLALAAEICG